MIEVVDTNNVVLEIIAALHKNKIPLALIPVVFERVNKKIQSQTIPYNPNFLEMKDEAISETTDKVTDPKG